jgi:hypothetical protein
MFFQELITLADVGAGAKIIRNWVGAIIAA